MDPVTATVIIIAAASALGALVGGCGGSSGGSQEDGGWDAGPKDGPPPDGPQSLDASDASGIDDGKVADDTGIGDGPPPDGNISLDASDASGLDGGGGTDGGNVDSGAACVQPRNGINDDYAKTTFGSQCTTEDLDIIGGKIFGVCSYPLNKVFACQIHTDPMETTTCTEAFTIDSSSGTLDGGAPMQNKPGQLVDLGDGRIALTYDTEGPYPNGIIIIDSSTYTLIQNIALGAIQYMSGSSWITVMPRPSGAPVFLNEHLFVVTENYNVNTGKYERGTVVVFKKDGLNPRKFDLQGISLFFTNGRNPTAIAAKDDHTLAVLNAHGPSSTIPAPGPGEVSGSSIDIVDVTQPTNPVFPYNVPIGDVELQKLPKFVLTADKTKAIVGSSTSPLTIYNVDISGLNTIQSAKLLNATSANITSIALTQETPQTALASLSDGNLYEVNLGTMADAGASLYLGLRPHRSAISADGRYLLQNVMRANCESVDESRLIAVDTPAALP